MQQNDVVIRYSVVFVVNFDRISYLVLVLLLLSLNIKMIDGNVARAI